MMRKPRKIISTKERDECRVMSRDEDEEEGQGGDDGWRVGV